MTADAVRAKQFTGGLFFPHFSFHCLLLTDKTPTISVNYSKEPFLKIRKQNICVYWDSGSLKTEGFSQKLGPNNDPMAPIGAGVSNLLGEALLGLNLVMLLCCHSVDIS